MHLYEILGVRPDAPYQKIHDAYREKMCRIEKRGTAFIFCIYDAAYIFRYSYYVLSDPKRRGEYDSNPDLYTSFTLPEYLII